MSTAISLKVNDDQLALIEALANECNLAAMEQAGHFLKAFRVAAGISALERAISNDMMQYIMQLQGSSLGFKADKMYDVATVKRCAIEAILRGGYLVGNEFNIIAGNTYMAQAFFVRKVREFPGVTGLQDHPGVPTIKDGSALVPYIVTYKLNGQPQSVERVLRKIDDANTIDERIPVKVNSGQGPDAVMGKAKRKMYAAVYARLTGSELPDGDAEDAPAPAPSTLSALSEKLAAGQSNGNGNGAIANIDVVLSKCKKITEVSEFEEYQLAEPSLDDDQRAIVREKCEAARQAIRGSRGERSNTATATRGPGDREME